MSALYNFLTHDPEPRHGGVLGCETSEHYHRRRIRRLKLQRLLIRSFPREFQALDEYVFEKQRVKVGRVTSDAGPDLKNELVAAHISTFTGRDRLVASMIMPIRQRLGKEPPPEPPKNDELKALRWVKGGRWAELDRPPVRAGV